MAHFLDGASTGARPVYPRNDLGRHGRAMQPPGRPPPQDKLFIMPPFLCIHTAFPAPQSVPLLVCALPAVPPTSSSPAYPEVGQHVAALHVLHAKADLAEGILLVLQALMALKQRRQCPCHPRLLCRRIISPCSPSRPTFCKSARDTSKTRPFRASDAICG